MESNNNAEDIEKLIVLKKEFYQEENIINANAEDIALVDSYFDSITCGDKDIENLLYEIISLCCTKTNKFHKAFIFKGTGRNSKSTVVRIIEKLLSEENCIEEADDQFDDKSDKKEHKYCSHEHIERLCGSKAGSKNTVSFLKGCTMNVAEDQHQVKFIDNGILTKLISGEPIAVGKVGKEKDDFTPYATLIFTVNEVIDFKEVGIHIMDRYLVIPFRQTYTDENNNRDIDKVSKLTQESILKIIATRAIKALREANERGHLTLPLAVKEETEKYFMDCNEVLEFCNLYPIKKLITKVAYYNIYKDWCNANGKEKLNNVYFGKRVLALGYKEARLSFAGKRENYYTNPKCDNDGAREEYNRYLISISCTEKRVSNIPEETLIKEGKTTWQDYQINEVIGDRID